jgi:hypothetical protein
MAWFVNRIRTMNDFDVQPRFAQKMPGESSVLGFVGPDLPIEVLLATGRPFGHLPWSADGITPWADRWLESGFPGWARSILEQWHQGAFDALHAVVFSRADDASQRLFYYVRELQQRGLLQGPRPLVFDIALIPRESSLAHTAESVLALAQTLGVPAAALPGAIERANILRRRLQQVQQGRTARGDRYERLMRAVLWNDPSSGLADFSPAEQPARHRVLLAGSTPPDERLHLAVEQAGASVIAEAHAHSLERLGPPIAASNEAPHLAIARHLRACSVGSRSFLDRARWVVERASASRAAAVILWLTREDEALAWQVPAQRKALAAEGIPALILPAADWLAGDDTLQQITQFCRNAFQ